MKNQKYMKVYIEITNICNRNCSFCPGTKRAKRRMSFEEFSAVVKQLEGMTEYLYFHLMGEPLTHPELPRFIEYASALGFKCAITTNGTLLDTRGDEILNSKPYKVNISLHFFEKGEENDYYKYLATVCKFANKASSQGILTVLRLWNKGYDGGMNDTTLNYLESALDGEWKWGVRGARIRHKLHLEYGERFDWPSPEAEEGEPKVFCYGLSDHFGVLADGTVVPCCLDSDGNLALGNIFLENITDILKSERAEKILDGFKNRCAAEKLCRRCGYARRFKV